MLTDRRIEERLLDFLTREVIFNPDQVPITADTPLFEGLLDSLDALRLVVYLEETYGIVVAAQELVPENFANARRLTSYVVRTIAGGQEGG